VLLYRGTGTSWRPREASGPKAHVGYGLSVDGQTIRCTSQIRKSAADDVVLMPIMHPFGVEEWH